ncbi:MAG TPA: hypothetical protein DHV28_16285 [Ignavibacteriales bacterium]|nr:hypothetical protein [Ignavibacteriales bacterium]
MSRLEFLIDWYNQENERKNSLNDSLNIPIGILTAFFVMIFFLFKEFNFSNKVNNWIIYLFVVFLILSLILWIISIFYLFKSYNNLFKGYAYDYLPYAKELSEQYQNLEKYYEVNKNLLENNITPDILYEKQLIDMLSEYIDTHIKNNDRKSKYLHIAKQFIFGTIISIIICSVPFLFNYSKNTNEIHNVKIENFGELNDKIESIKVQNLNDIKYEKERNKIDTTTTTTTTIKENNKGGKGTTENENKD